VTTLNVSLPDSLRRFVEEQVERGGFSTTSEYIRHLIRQARESEAFVRLENLLLEGLHSGPAEPITRSQWDALRLQVAEERAEYRPEIDTQREGEGTGTIETESE